MDRIIEVKVRGNYVIKDNKNAGTQGEANVTALRIEFDESWDGYAKTITWWDARGQNPTPRILTADLLEDITASTRIYLTPIPGEALVEWGECMFSIDGFTNGRRSRSAYAKMVVVRGKNATILEDVTPSVAEQLQVQIDNLLDTIQVYAAAASTNAKVAEDAAKAASASANSADNFRAISEQFSARAVEAFTGAANAQSGAQTAQSAAETAKTGAEKAAADAAKAKTGAESAKSAAESAKSQANTSAQNASASAKAAAASEETAANAASAAQTAVSNVGQAVQSASGSASSAAAHAEAAAGFASTAKAQASAASEYSNSAQLAQSAAENAASNAADSATDAANAVSNRLAGYVDDAQTAAGNAASSATNAEAMKDAATDKAAAAQDAASAATAAQKAAEEARDEALRQVQSDWNENDPTKASHTLHRTHWKETIGEDAEIIPEASAKVGAEAELGAMVTGSESGLQEGVWYAGTIGGLDFEGRCQKYGYDLYIGNGHKFNEALEDTGEWFCIVDFAGGYYNIFINNMQANASFKVSMRSVQETVWHPLDPNYVDFVLKSPGGKKFRVTVSDSGALSAVEVTE